MVNASGEVKWLSHGIFKSSCDISVEYFPFDIQICKMKWASWTYDALGVSDTIFHFRVWFDKERDEKLTKLKDF